MTLFLLVGVLHIHQNDTLSVYSDASRTERVVGIGYVIETENTTIEGSSTIASTMTSMESEHHALCEAVRVASQRFSTDVTVYTDCQPLARKLTAESLSDESWRDRQRSAEWLLAKFDEWEIEWIPRNENERANRLAREARWNAETD